MPDVIPPAAFAAAEQAIIEAATDFGHDDLVCGSFREFARAALEAAAPLLAEARGAFECQPLRAAKPAATRDERARIACRRCGAGPGLQCVTSSGTRAPVVHAERRNDWRRAQGQVTGLEAEGVHVDRFPPRSARGNSEVPREP
jgi:hypothetical protein